MKIKLNLDLLKYKKGIIIDLDKVIYNEKIYFQKRIEDSKIDNCVEIVKETIKNENISQKPQNSEKKYEIIKENKNTKKGD